MPEFDDDRPEAPPAEGVRILGAEEAQAAVDGGPDRPEARGAAASATPLGAARRRAARGPIPAARRPTPGRRSRTAGAARARRRRSVRDRGAMPLPHWTEPATGEVPMIADEPGDEEVWAAASNEPRFRSDAGDYGDSDFALGDDGLHDETTAMGALVDVPEIDDDEEFAAQVAARRAAPARRSRTKPARSRRGAAAAAAGSQFPTIEDETDAPHVTATPRVTPSGDDLTTRIITGAVLAAVALLAFVIGRAGTTVLVTVIVAAATFELFEGFRRAGFQPATLLALLGSVSMVRHRLQPRRTGVPARHRSGRRLHVVLVPVQGRARPADGQRRGHDLRVHLRRRPRRVRRPAARVPRRCRHDHRARAVRGELRRRRLLRRLAARAPTAHARRLAEQDPRGPGRRHGRVGRDGHPHRHHRPPPRGTRCPTVCCSASWSRSSPRSATSSSRC